MTDIVPYKADDNADDKLKETFEIVILGTCISNSAFVAPYYQKYGMSDERLYSHGLLHGGNGALQAIVAARMGAKVALITRKCSDDLTQMCLSALRIAGVSTKYVVPCYDRDITDENTLTCECGFKQPDAPYLTAEDVRKFAPIISSAKVVIVHYEIGYSAAYEALKLCKDTVSILFASPLPNVNAKHLFSMTQFVIFDGDNDLQVHYKFKTWLYPNERRSSPDCRETAENRVRKDRKNPVANLVRYSLEIGAKNAIVCCYSNYRLLGGTGFNSSSNIKAEVKGLYGYPNGIYNVNSISTSCECIVYLAVVLLRYFVLPNNSERSAIDNNDLEFILRISSNVAKFFSTYHLTKGLHKSEFNDMIEEWKNYYRCCYISLD